MSISPKRKYNVNTLNFNVKELVSVYAVYRHQL